MSTLRLILPFASCMLVSLLVAQTDQITGPPITTVHFEAMEHDLGRIHQDSEHPLVFRFTNTGNAPLIIAEASGSCGCTVPEYDRHPIPPGGEGEISVVYKPGKQQGQQHKTVTITANTEPAEILLRVNAHVLETDEGYNPLPWPLVDVEATDPVGFPSAQEGPITTVQFDTMDHDFGQILQGSENPHVFKFRNTGDVPLIISDARGSCGCTVPYFARDPIPPGSESEIHIVYKPGMQEGEQRKVVTITANTQPSQTVLRVRAEVLRNDAATAPHLFMLDEEQELERAEIESLSPGCFVIFPNPTSNELRLDLKEHIGRSADVRIHDQTGRDMLRTRIAEINSEASRLDVASFPSGIYIATIQVEGGPPMSQCFVVSR